MALDIRAYVLYADMVELVDTQDLESCEATRAGSIPVIRTKTVALKSLNIHKNVNLTPKTHILHKKLVAI